MTSLAKQVVGLRSWPSDRRRFPLTSADDPTFTDAYFEWASGPKKRPPRGAEANVCPVPDRIRVVVKNFGEQWQTGKGGTNVSDGTFLNPSDDYRRCTSQPPIAVILCECVSLKMDLLDHRLARIFQIRAVLAARMFELRQLRRRVQAAQVVSRRQRRVRSRPRFR